VFSACFLRLFALKVVSVFKGKEKSKGFLFIFYVGATPPTALKVVSVFTPFYISSPQYAENNQT